jgi:hypothetical protein
MDRKKFYKIIDDLTEGWYIDATPPLKGTWATKVNPKGGPRRKTNQKGEENEINETSGEVQVLKWADRTEFCVQCSKPCKNKVEQINLNNGQIKCSCGLKYPIVNISTIS